MITVIITFKKCHKDSPERQTIALRSSRKRNTLYKGGIRTFSISVAVSKAHVKCGIRIRAQRNSIY